MSENLTSNNIENEDFNNKTDESESVYKILITRLKQIRETITLLEKTINR